MTPVQDVSRRATLLALAAIAIASFGVRLWLLHAAIADAPFSPGDPDGYFRNGRLLAQNGEGWRWTLDAVRYPWDGRPYLLPPLYTVFLSLFVLAFDPADYWAAVGQIALNAASSAALFAIAAALHSRRAGLIAAFIFAFWLPNIWMYAQFMQEQLYIPLLLIAFALLVRATATPASPAAFAGAGVAFGCAALTRSMPMYFVVLAASGYAVALRDRASVKRAAALLGGFLLVTGLYSLWLSPQVGQFVYIENHAGISIHSYGGTRPSGVPAHQDIVSQLTEAFLESPSEFAGLWWGYARALFHVHGDRWLHFYRADSPEGAVTAKITAHLGIDLPFILSVVLAPLGVVLARRRREAILLAGWIVLVVTLTALSATGGVRYRSPFEPQLIALASVVLAGGWRAPGRIPGVVALLVTLAAASIVVAQLPRVVRARANYGLVESSDADGATHVSIVGRVGLNMLPKDGILEMQLSAADPDVMPQPAHVSFWVDGRHVADRALQDEPLRMRFVGRHLGVHYVELHAVDAAGRPARVSIDLISTSVGSYGSAP